MYLRCANAFVQSFSFNFLHELLVGVICARVITPPFSKLSLRTEFTDNTWLWWALFGQKWTNKVMGKNKKKGCLVES